MIETHHKMNRSVPGNIADALHHDLLTLNCKTVKNYVQWQPTFHMSAPTKPWRPKTEYSVQAFCKRDCSECSEQNEEHQNDHQKLIMVTLAQSLHCVSLWRSNPHRILTQDSWEKVHWSGLKPPTRHKNSFGCYNSWIATAPHTTETKKRHLYKSYHTSTVVLSK